MSHSTTKMLMDECKKFCRVKKLVGMEPELYKLAARSYYAMPKNKRHLWSLKQIDVQGI